MAAAVETGRDALTLSLRSAHLKVGNLLIVRGGSWGGGEAIVTHSLNRYVETTQRDPVLVEG